MAWYPFHVVCSRLEAKFQVLLRDEFSTIWRILKRERPTEPLRRLALVPCGAQGVPDPADTHMRPVKAECSMGRQCLPAFDRRQGGRIQRDREGPSTPGHLRGVLCWTSMTLDPDLELDQGQPGRSVSQRQQKAGEARHLSFRAKGASRKDESSTNVPLSQTARRPVAKVFRGLRSALEASPGHRRTRYFNSKSSHTFP